MAGNGASGASSAKTPAKPVPSKSTASTATKQRSIASFFQKSSPQVASSPSESKVGSATPPASSTHLKETTKANSLPKTKITPSMARTKLSTPVASSDALEPPSSQENKRPAEEEQRLASPSTMPTKVREVAVAAETNGSSPSRKVSYYQTCEPEGDTDTNRRRRSLVTSSRLTMMSHSSTEFPSRDATVEPSAQSRRTAMMSLEPMLLRLWRKPNSMVSTNLLER